MTCHVWWYNECASLRQPEGVQQFCYMHVLVLWCMHVMQKDCVCHAFVCFSASDCCLLLLHQCQFPNGTFRFQIDADNGPRQSVCLLQTRTHQDRERMFLEFECFSKFSCHLCCKVLDQSLIKGDLNEDVTPIEAGLKWRSCTAYMFQTK